MIQIAQIIPPYIREISEVKTELVSVLYLEFGFRGDFKIEETEREAILSWDPRNSRDEVGQYAEEVLLFVKGYCCAKRWLCNSLL